MRMIAIASFLLFTVACTAAPNVGVVEGGIPKDSANRCTSLCGSIGFALDAVVVMAHNVGCVCRAAAAPSAPTPTAATSTTGGMAAVMIQQQAAAAAQQQQQQRQQQQQYRPPPGPR